MYARGVRGRAAWRQNLFVVASALLVAAAVLPVTAFGQTRGGKDVRYVPLDRAAFVQQNVVDGWINAAAGPDLTSIYGHAWELWRQLNKPSGQTLRGTPLPIWETWYSGEEVYLDNREVADPDSRDLDDPNQSLHSGALAVETGSAPRIPATVLTFNKFNRQMLDHIQQNGYYDKSTLQQMSDDFDSAGTQTDLRTITPFENTATMLKPAWWIVPGDEPSMVPYWAGDTSDATTDPSVPLPGTWKQCVLVDPTGKAKANIGRTCNTGNKGQTTMDAGAYDVVPVAPDPKKSDFYAFRLNQDEVDALPQERQVLHSSNKQGKLRDVKAGDLAILTSMHVVTLETGNWAWQTFWWAPDPQAPAASPPDAQVPPSDIPAPFDHFNMCASYFMTTPVAAQENGEPWICYNPYLETDLTGLLTVDKSVSDEVGVHSNCMSCHRAAVYTADRKVDYVVNGYLDKGNAAFFGDGVITGFLWSLPIRAHDAPFVGPTDP